MEDPGSIFFDWKRDSRIFDDTPKKRAFYFPSTEVLRESKESPVQEHPAEDDKQFELNPVRKRILELKEERLQCEFEERFEEVWPNEEGIIDQIPIQKEVKVVEVERPLVKDWKRPDPNISADSLTNTPLMSKLVQNFRNAPAKSRAERSKERNGKPSSILKQHGKDEMQFPHKDSSENEKFDNDETAVVGTSKEPSFWNTALKPKLKPRGLDNSLKQLPEQEDEVEMLNRRIADVLSQSESLTASNSFSLSSATETSLKLDDVKPVRKEISSKQVHTSKMLQTVAPVRKEDDILYQWRLRRKVESARRGTQFMIAEKEYECHGKRNLKLDEDKLASVEVINRTPNVNYVGESRKVQMEEDLNVTLSELRQKMRYGSQNSDDRGNSRDSAIVNAVEQTLKQDPLFEKKQRKENNYSRSQIDSKYTDVSSGRGASRDMKSRNNTAAEATSKNGCDDLSERQFDTAPPKQIQAATTTTQTETCSSEASINPMFTNAYNAFPYFFPPFNNPFVTSYQLPPQLGNTIPGFVAPINFQNTPFNNTYSRLQYNSNQLPVLRSNANGAPMSPSQVETFDGLPVKKSDHLSRLLVKKSSSKRNSQLKSVDSTLTNVSSLDITQDVSRVSSEKVHTKTTATKNNWIEKGSKGRFCHEVTELQKCVSDPNRNNMQCNVIGSVAKEHADSLMWSKCDKYVSLPRFERVDFKLHYVSAETAERSCEVQKYLQAAAVNIELIQTVSESKAIVSLPSQTADYSYDLEESPQTEILHDQLLRNSLSVTSLNGLDSVPEDIESNHDSEEQDDQKRDTLTLTRDAEMQTDLTGPCDDSRSSRELQLVEDLNFSIKSCEKAIQTTDVNLVDDETQTKISVEIHDASFGSIKTKCYLGSDVDSNEQIDPQDDLVDADIEEILRSDIDHDLNLENLQSESEDLSDMKRKLEEAYEKVCLQKENLEKILSSFDD